MTLTIAATVIFFIKIVYIKGCLGAHIKGHEATKRTARAIDTAQKFVAGLAAIQIASYLKNCKSAGYEVAVLAAILLLPISAYAYFNMYVEQPLWASSSATRNALCLATQRAGLHNDSCIFAGEAPTFAGCIAKGLGQKTEGEKPE